MHEAIPNAVDTDVACAQPFVLVRHALVSFERCQVEQLALVKVTQPALVRHPKLALSTAAGRAQLSLGLLVQLCKQT